MSSTTVPTSTPMAVNNGRPVISHGMADVEPGVRIHYVLAGDGPRTIVLLHGFPETWRQWQPVIPLLVGAGFRVVAADYRGAGDSWHPAGGYDKFTMAQDIHTLVQDKLGIGEPVVMVGHDVGLWIGYAYARRYPDDVSHLAIMEAPVPGTAVFDQLRPRLWHFAFTRSATCRKRWWPAGSGYICSNSSRTGTATHRRSAPPSSTPTWPPIPRQAQCARPSRPIGHSIRTPLTTAPNWSSTASCQCRCCFSAASSASRSRWESR